MSLSPGSVTGMNPTAGSGRSSASPFIFLEYKPVEYLSFDLGYFPVRSVHAGISWHFRDSVTLRAAFAWDKDSYFRADRTDKNNRIFAYEKRLTASCLWRVHEQAALDLSAGYVFDRMLFEGENYSDRGFNRIGISEGPFLAGRLRVSF